MLCARNMHVINESQNYAAILKYKFFEYKREQRVSDCIFTITLRCTHCQMDRKKKPGVHENMAPSCTV